MQSYLIYQKTAKDQKAIPTEYVSDSFNIWAMLFGILWCFYHRLWLASIVLVLLNAALNTLHNYGALSSPIYFTINLLLALFVGWEGNLWRQKQLKKWGYNLVGIAVANDIAEAELRFLYQQQKKYD